MHGFAEVECACGCENLLPLTLFNRGWHYLWGHKPLDGEPGVPKQTRRVPQPRAPRPGPVECVSFDRTLDMVADNLIAAMQRRGELEAEYNAANVRVGELAGKITAVAARIAQLEYLGRALEPFLAKPSEGVRG